MRKYFITGVVILLPLAVTIAIVVFIMNFLTDPFIGFVENFLTSITWNKTRLSDLIPYKAIHYSAQVIILITLFCFTLLLGFFARWFLIRYLIRLSDKLLQHIPLVNKIYKTTQEIINTFFRKETKSFQRVVLVPFPSKQTYSLGLVSRDAPKKFQELTGNKLVSIFIPTTPNPTSGFILMFQESEVIDLDIRTEDALKFIVSCGVIHPDSLQITENSE